MRCGASVRVNRQVSTNKRGKLRETPSVRRGKGLNRMLRTGRTKLEIVRITESQYLLREIIGWRIKAEKFR